MNKHWGIPFKKIRLSFNFNSSSTTTADTYSVGKTKDFKPKFLSFIGGALFSIIWAGLIIVSYRFFDKPIAYYFLQYKDTTLFEIMSFIGQFGTSTYYIVGFTLLYLFTHFIKKNVPATAKVGFLLKTSVISGLLCLILKVALSRARPTELFSEDLFGFFFFKTEASFWSFPSGHSTTISAIMLGFTLLVPRYALLACTALLLVSFSRVAVTAHYLSDILAGIYLGGFTSLWLYYSYAKKTTNAMTQSSIANYS